MFGRVQAKLFPQYFATATAAIVLQIGTLAFGTPTGIARPQLITLGEHLRSAECAASRTTNLLVESIADVPSWPLSMHCSRCAPWCCAGVALATGLANWLYIEPVATDLMFERYALENAEGERDGAKIKALYKQFGIAQSHHCLWHHNPAVHWSNPCLLTIYDRDLITDTQIPIWGIIPPW